MTFGAPCPILRIFDVSKAMDHYVGFLGFKVDWEHRFGEGCPLYCQVSQGDCILHLSEHHGDACPGASVRVRLEGLDEYQALLLGKKYAYSRPGIETMPWGCREVAVPDPFGNKLTFWDEVAKA